VKRFVLTLCVGNWVRPRRTRRKDDKAYSLSSLQCIAAMSKMARKRLDVEASWRLMTAARATRQPPSRCGKETARKWVSLPEEFKP